MSTTISTPPVRVHAWGFLVVSLLFMVVISCGGWYMFKDQQASARKNAQETLTTIADLKVDQIANWMKERRGDAEIALNNHTAQQFLTGPADTALREELLQWMITLQRIYSYKAVALIDSRGVARLTVPASILPDKVEAQRVKTLC
jgi:hypothetical protein